MKIFVVYIGNIMHCPPALSIVQALNDLSFESVLCTIGENNSDIENSIGKLKNVTIKLVGDSYKSNISLSKKFYRMYQIRDAIWNIIDNEYDKNSLIWVVAEESVKHLGNQILKRNYILHLLELNEGIYYISGNPILKLNYKKIAQNAKVVVEAEYNRAHITKAWWNLKKIPMVLPNKPYNKMSIQKNAQITSRSDVRILMDKLKDKKIILYQGNISKERPLREYVKAVGELGNEYAFVMMINGENPYVDLKYDNFYCIPFVKPPFHLEVTSHAYIGILSYTPIKNSYSILNTLYCAPNKVWEYAQFGIPMIGNDLPALKSMFLEYHNGISLQKMKKDEIKKTIKKIEMDYKQYSNYSQIFFNSVDIKNIVHEILEKASK